MSTDIRPELSEKNKYWIDRHRYYELKHFCLQYPIWKKAYSEIDSMSKTNYETPLELKSQNAGSPVERCADKRLFYSERIELIDRTAIDTSPELSRYILKAVTEGYSYDYLRTTMDIPCCKDTYYELYRRFFWLLSEARK